MSKNIDQNIIIENRPVAGGALAVLLGPGHGARSLTIRCAPISLTFRLPTLLVVRTDSSAKTVAELLAWGKTKLGGLLLGSPGAGTPGHLLAAKIALATNTPIQFIHYRGGAPSPRSFGRSRSMPRRDFPRCLTFPP